MSFWGEIRRRNVFKVGVAYLAFAWLTVQIAAIVLPAFDIPQWAMQALIFAFALGLPIVLVCAWVYELTPEGLKRTEDAPAEPAPALHKGRKLDFAIITVLSLALVAVVVNRYVIDTQPPDDTIAVLPFANLSGDPDEEYFADGMTEALIANLAKIESLKVISRTSAMRFKDTTLPLPEVAAALHATRVVEASTQRDGGHVRIIAQLVDGATDRHLWAETFDRDLADVLTLQSELAQQIAREIQAAVTPEEAERLGASERVNPAAYEAYLRGMQHFYRLTPPEIDNAEMYFEQALMLDADFARALAGRALVWVARAQTGAMSPNNLTKPRNDA